MNDPQNPSPQRGEGGANSALVEWEGEGLAAEWLRLPTETELLTRARWMRKNPTEAERRLWSMLRDRRLDAYKFRRQHILFPYIVDFACLRPLLIIEADGSQHADSRDDERRDETLKSQGFAVLRFWNNDVLSNADGVFAVIASALDRPSPSHAFGASPSLSPLGRGAGEHNA